MITQMSLHAVTFYALEDDGFKITANLRRRDKLITTLRRLAMCKKNFENSSKQHRESLNITFKI